MKTNGHAEACWCGKCRDELGLSPPPDTKTIPNSSDVILNQSDEIERLRHERDVLRERMTYLHIRLDVDYTFSTEWFDSDGKCLPVEAE